MSIFSNYLIFYYTKHIKIITIMIILLFINILYYVYWVYYITSMFHFYDTSIVCTYYYNEFEDNLFYNNIPSIDINISLFDLQSSIWYIIIWSTIIIGPYFMLRLNKQKPYKYYNINIILSLYAIMMITHTIYIPQIIQYYYEYYQVYQIQHESLSINIEYNIIGIIRHLIFIIISSVVIVLCSVTKINRNLMIISYILMMPWSQPNMSIILSVTFVIATIEIISIIYIANLNYLAKIAGLCTEAHI